MILVFPGVGGTTGPRRALLKSYCLFIFVFSRTGGCYPCIFVHRISLSVHWLGCGSAESASGDARPRRSAHRRLCQHVRARDCARHPPSRRRQRLRMRHRLRLAEAPAASSPACARTESSSRVFSHVRAAAELPLARSTSCRAPRLGRYRVVILPEGEDARPLHVEDVLDLGDYRLRGADDDLIVLLSLS